MKFLQKGISWAKFPLIFLLYYYSAKFGLKINAVSGFASMVWPPTGIALASVLICDFQIWPCIFLGAFLINWQTGAPILAAVGIGIGNTAEALLGAYFLKRVSGFKNFFESFTEVSTFILLTVLGSTMISAHIGVFSLWVSHIITPATYLPTWKAWWVGDMLGNLIMTPLILIWIKKPLTYFSWKKLFEIIGFGFFLLVITGFVFGNSSNNPISIYQLPTLVFPLIIWASIRFGTRGAASTSVIVSTIATWGTLKGYGPYTSHSLIDNLLRLQIFMGIVSATGLILSAVVAERKKAESALRESESKIRAVLESTLDGIIVIDHKGIIGEMNSASEHLFGYHRLQLLGKPLAECVFPPEKRESGISDLIVSLVNSDGSPFHKRLEMSAHRSTGTEFPVEISVTRIKDSFPPLFTVFIRDLTDQKMAKEILRQTRANLEESEERFQAFMKHTPTLTWIKDEQGRVIYVNERLEQLFNVSLERIKGKFDFEWFADKEVAQKTMESDRSVLEKNIPQEMIEVVATPDGQEHIWNVLKFPFRDTTGKTYVGGNAFDITSRVKTEEALRANEKMLLQKTEELEQSNRELDDFAYIASHDLKEPLRGIANYARFIMEDYQSKLDTEGQKRLQTLANLPRQMEALINDLLLFSRVGRLGLSIHDVDLNLMMDNITTLLKPILEEQHVDIQIPRPLPTICCDRSRLSEVFQNLITNALKYNDKTDKKIEIEFREPENGFYTFYIKDNGIGIPEKHFDAIFRMFKRLHPRKSYGGGSGAGLTIVKKIIERHHGKIGIESTIGMGTTFYFTIPDNLEKTVNVPEDSIYNRFD